MKPAHEAKKWRWYGGSDVYYVYDSEDKMLLGEGVEIKRRADADSLIALLTELRERLP